MEKFIRWMVLSLCMMAICSCGTYQGGGERTGKLQFGLDKDRTHRYEEGQQRRIDEDKYKRIEMDRNKDSKTGSVRYFIN